MSPTIRYGGSTAAEVSMPVVMCDFAFLLCLCMVMNAWVSSPHPCICDASRW